MKIYLFLISFLFSSHLSAQHIKEYYYNDEFGSFRVQLNEKKKQLIYIYASCMTDKVKCSYTKKENELNLSCSKRDKFLESHQFYLRNIEDILIIEVKDVGVWELARVKEPHIK